MANNSVLAKKSAPDAGISPWLLIEWVGENRVTAIARSSVIGEKDKSMPDSNLLGRVVFAKWGKGNRKRPCKGKVCNLGTLVDMKFEQRQSENEIKRNPKPGSSKMMVQKKNVKNIHPKKPLKRINAKRTPRKTPRKTPGKEKPAQLPNPAKVQKVLDKAKAVQHLQERGNQINNEVEMARVVREEEDNHYKQLYEAEVFKTEQMSKTIAGLRKRLEAFENRSAEVVTLAPNVSMSKDTLEGMALCTSNPNVFARALLSLLFTDEELAGKSFSGKKCNANTQDVKPGIDPERRDAVLRETLRIYGKDRDHKKNMLSNLRRSLGDKVREVGRRGRRVLVAAWNAGGNDDDNLLM